MLRGRAFVVVTRPGVGPGLGTCMRPEPRPLFVHCPLSAREVLLMRLERSVASTLTLGLPVRLMQFPRSLALPNAAAGRVPGGRPVVGMPWINWFALVLAVLPLLLGGLGAVAAAVMQALATAMS